MVAARLLLGLLRKVCSARFCNRCLSAGRPRRAQITSPHSLTCFTVFRVAYRCVRPRTCRRVDRRGEREPDKPAKDQFRQKQRHMEQMSESMHLCVRSSLKFPRTWNEPPSFSCSDSEPCQTSIDVLRTSAMAFTRLIYHGSLMLSDETLSIRHTLSRWSLGLLTTNYGKSQCWRGPRQSHCRTILSTPVAMK